MTDRYAVIGNPIAHSKSPQIHAEFARQTGEDIAYAAILASLNEFEKTVQDFIAGGGKGMNVTVPFKQQAYAMCDELSERAQLAGAVNTLTFADRKILGDTTDGKGLIRDIIGNLGFDIEGKNVLVIGAGGAARGALAPLLRCNPSRLVIANRTHAKAAELARLIAPLNKKQKHIEAKTFEQLANEKFDLLINATSASLNNALPDMPKNIQLNQTLAYDMMYAKLPTAFMKYATQHGAARVNDGLGMLVEQAAESFFVWRSVRPETKLVLKKIRAAM
ncbi:MAG: shikimate dehydrogenase [Pseudomonadota bacterium]|jgi:shikimate dehydrogenase